VKKNKMALQARSLSPQESRVALALSERGLKGVAREDIIKLLSASSKAVDNIMESLRRKAALNAPAAQIPAHPC
jgi:hypothetical protein